jgi:acetolactate synthase-1/2/3 large subunit
LRTGAQLLCDALEAAGVRHAFGLPGTQDLALHEALRRSRIQFVNTTHELAATFMANGYLRASGRLAPVFAISGPGFMYALTGLAEAAQDSVATLLVVGAPPPGGRSFQFQWLDQAGLARPIAKAVVELREVAEVEPGTRRAVALALEDEPGPVLLQWAPGALAGSARPSEAARATVVPGPDAALEEACDRAAALLAGARRPIILAGQGALAAAGLVADLAGRLGAPVATTTSGRGVVPEDHPWSLAFELARGGLDGLNALAEAADAVLVLGCKLGAASSGDFRLALPAGRTVRVDTSRAVLAAGYPAAVEVCRPVEAFLPALARRLGPGPAGPGMGWPTSEVATWRARLSQGATGRLPEAAFGGLTPPTAQALFGALRRALPREGIVVTDSGQHQELARRWLEVWSPRGLIVPSDFQSMGFGLPAAIGAALSAPGRPVVAVLGDGAFAMSAMELLTAVRLRLKLVVLVLADGHFNRIRLQQLATSGHAHGVDLLNPDFAAFAEAVGAAYEVVEGAAEPVFQRALRRPGVTVLEVRSGDSAAVHRARARGLARGLRRLPLARRLARWLTGRPRT